MELDLKKTVIPCYHIALSTTLAQEETQEAIVPDACPDIAEILSVSGQICLGDTQILDGQVTVTGHVETVVLYHPEEGTTLEKISLRLPFRTQAVGESLTASHQIFAHPTFCRGDARTLNPRKVLVRMDILTDVVCYGHNAQLLCSGVEGAEIQGVAQEITPQTIHPLTAVQSKHFTFDEVITLQGQGEAGEVVSLRIFPHCTESKLIGNKLIFKGETELQLMYLDEQGQLSQSRHQLPFSQIMEMDDPGEGSTSAVSVVVESYYLSPSYDGGRSLELTLDLVAQATVRSGRPITLLQDAYSISHHLTLEKETYDLVVMAEDFVVALPVRQIFETAHPIQTVEDSWVTASKITQTQEGNQRTFAWDLTLSLLTTGENGRLQRLDFTHPVSHTVEMTPDASGETHCYVRCNLPGEVFATVAPGGVEIRLTPQLTYSLIQTQPIEVVSTAMLGEPRERTTASVVLRLTQTGETLWDIAKHYGTTTRQILLANDLPEDSLPLGKMLLIPSVR